MKTFQDLHFKPSFNGGRCAEMKFPNGYEISVVRQPGSYGWNNELYELAIADEHDLVYDTHITNDVIGHLTPDEVTEKMRLVQELPPITIDIAMEREALRRQKEEERKELLDIIQADIDRLKKEQEDK